jgi:hypothetical protein
MTQDAYRRYLDAFGDRIDAAAAPPPRRRGLLAGAVVVVAAIVALVVFLATPSGERKINLVAEARAALPSSGELLHLATVSTTSLIGADDAAQQRFDEFARRHHDEYAPRYFEQWSAGDRWRVAGPTNKVFPKLFAGEPYYPGFYISDQELQQVRLTDEVIGPTQEAFEDGIDTLYVESLGVIIRSNLRAAGWDTDVGSFPGGIYTGSPTLLGSDPVAAIRKQLDRGNLHDAGAAEVDGRSVRRLVSQDGNFEYDVDAKSFEPVRVRMFSHWVGPLDSPYPPEKMAEDVNFETFETLPLNSETERLLTIDAPPGTTVIDAQGPDEQPPRKDR